LCADPFKLTHYLGRRAIGDRGAWGVASNGVRDDSRADLGRAGERAAEEFLRRRGYTIVERNFRCRGGEVDLIALRRGVVVFVEVKTRRRGAAVGPFEAVTPRKRRRLLCAARHYLARYRLEDRAARFDVVAVWADSGGGLKCEVVEAAFDAGG